MPSTNASFNTNCRFRKNLPSSVRVQIAVEFLQRFGTRHIATKQPRVSIQPRIPEVLAEAPRGISMQRADLVSPPQPSKYDNAGNKPYTWKDDFNKPTNQCPTIQLSKKRKAQPNTPQPVGLGQPSNGKPAKNNNEALVICSGA